MLTPWKKAMTNLDSILKSRDITLPIKVCLVKAMVFPVVMYGCERWTIKNLSSIIFPADSRCCESFPASGSFPMSQFFTSGGQIIGV